ncbi:hypothetical protein A1Q2_02126 [Trichosporon asahii var. asahii CBS 8904]|uniref:GST C-terminal domain-containing protein n=1 Tax=Trichosporon asahii var. asahii (strain CBS 8904) TaxID=1220162 RepID=K1W3S1_TRIAC|nr:hypothetical protein A1Q2_02126 [Trichosporon asahii var. asahii CBS 8904]
MDPAEADVPKAVLYCWPTSALATVPRLALIEKGYSEDEYVISPVDITKGENFSHNYLKINADGECESNMHATDFLLTAGAIPTFAVPRKETKPGAAEPIYHMLCDTAVGIMEVEHALGNADRGQSICEFIDNCLPVGTPAAPGGRPSPRLSPATPADQSLSSTLIDLVRQSTVDPNFLYLSIVDKNEARRKWSGPQGAMLGARSLALRRYLQQYRQDVMSPAPSSQQSAEPRFISFLEQKALSNQAILDIYTGDAPEDRVLEFIEASRASWTVHLPSTLAKLESQIVGPYCLGDDLTFADCYVVAWLAQIVKICSPGMSLGPHGLQSVEQFIGGYRIGPKLHIYWGHWAQRTSFRKALQGL